MRLEIEAQIAVDFVFHPGSLPVIVGIRDDFQYPVEPFRLWYSLMAQVNHHVGWIQAGKRADVDRCFCGVLLICPGVW